MSEPQEDGLRREINRGQRAKALLENTILNEAFQKVDDECVRLWREAKDHDTREGMWLRLQSLQHVRTALEAVIKDGDLAQRKLEKLIAPKRRVF